ncbi:MAG TPA: DegT/DnrJ/EryC1/StrS family aminotransferase [Pseudobacteroides sp.]|uniref:DegT/DnrJ/EryC1/StrS family aminotransferase n=1 Tax=Pseudobacteroides sp. TaxID=1968840 RepID=UPI002F9403B1
MEIAPLKIAFSEEERKWILDRINESLKRGEISQGRNVQELEEKFAAYTRVKHAIAVNSGTSAIEIAMRILGVVGKEVLVPTNTFMATATGVLFAGGKVHLVDSDPKTLSISLKELKNRVTKDTAGVIIVHIGGIITPEINEIKKWCAEQGIWLFEDAAHAHGSAFNNCFAGGFGIAGSYSFFATKIITSGEGGIIVTNDDNLAEKARLYRNHGKPNAWVTNNTLLGSNWRMSDITAAIALAQLERLDEIITAREKLANKYNDLMKELLPDLKIVLPSSRSSWYKYIVLLPKGVSRDAVKQAIKDRGIGLQGEVYGIPLHKQPVAKEAGFEGNFPNADDVCERHICLPIYPSLTLDQVEKVVRTLASVLNETKT